LTTRRQNGTISTFNLSRRLEYQTKTGRSAGLPHAKELSSRLDTLLDTIFSDRLDLVSLFRQISAELPSSPPLALKKKLRRLLATVQRVSADSALLAAGVLRLTGFDSPRILHFLSLYVPGTISLSQFEFASQALFPRGLPMTQGMLYDLTQYTYLERRLLVRKSMEMSAALSNAVSPDLLLFLFLLSLRDDLSNENARLIALILKGVFPAFEQRARPGDELLGEYAEIAEALRNSDRNLPWQEAGRGDARASRPFDRQSASRFLDKYFSDAALANQRGAPVVEAPRAVLPPAPPRRASRPRTVSRPRQAARAKRAAVPVQAAAPVRAAAPVQAARAKRAAASIPSPARKREQASPRRTAAGWRIAVPLVPFFAGAAVVLALTILVVVFPPRPGDRAHRPAVPAAAAPAEAAPAAPGAETPKAADKATQPGPARTYVIREGDSLWRIYQSLNPDTPGRWDEFLSRIRADNGLVDPDRIWPGKTLTITPFSH
jgi:hypothetical protein